MKSGPGQGQISYSEHKLVPIQNIYRKPFKWPFIILSFSPGSQTSWPFIILSFLPGSQTSWPFIILSFIPGSFKKSEPYSQAKVRTILGECIGPGGIYTCVEVWRILTLI